jgi:RNA polymerase sigma-70 factor, ECF subfamily
MTSAESPTPPPDPAPDADALFSLVYTELHRIAERLARGDRDASVRATALVSDAYLALRQRQTSLPADQVAFLRVAARAMRHLLIDHKRARKTREQHVRPQSSMLDAIVDRCEASVGDLQDVEAALQRIGETDPDSVRLIELHFFAGLSLQECATTIGVSYATACRRWQLARARLAGELRR